MKHGICHQYHILTIEYHVPQKLLTFCSYSRIIFIFFILKDNHINGPHTSVVQPVVFSISGIKTTQLVITTDFLNAPGCRLAEILNAEGHVFCPDEQGFA